MGHIVRKPWSLRHTPQAGRLVVVAAVLLLLVVRHVSSKAVNPQVSAFSCLECVLML